MNGDGFVKGVPPLQLLPYHLVNTRVHLVIIIVRPKHSAKRDYSTFIDLCCLGTPLLLPCQCGCSRTVRGGIGWNSSTSLSSSSREKGNIGQGEWIRRKMGKIITINKWTDLRWLLATFIISPDGGAAVAALPQSLAALPPPPQRRRGRDCSKWCPFVRRVVGELKGGS